MAATAVPPLFNMTIRKGWLIHSTLGKRNLKTFSKLKNLVSIIVHHGVTVCVNLAYFGGNIFKDSHYFHLYTGMHETSILLQSSFSKSQVRPTSVLNNSSRLLWNFM